MFIDKVLIQTIGTHYSEGKTKKNQVLSENKANEGMTAKSFYRFLESYEEHLTNGYTDCTIEVKFKEKESD